MSKYEPVANVIRRLWNASTDDPTEAFNMSITLRLLGGPKKDLVDLGRAAYRLKDPKLVEELTNPSTLEALGNTAALDEALEWLGPPIQQKLKSQSVIDLVRKGAVPDLQLARSLPDVANYSIQLELRRAAFMLRVNLFHDTAAQLRKYTETGNPVLLRKLLNNPLSLKPVVTKAIGGAWLSGPFGGPLWVKALDAIVSRRNIRILSAARRNYFFAKDWIDDPDTFTDLAKKVSLPAMAGALVLFGGQSEASASPLPRIMEAARGALKGSDIAKALGKSEKDIPSWLAVNYLFKHQPHLADASPDEVVQTLQDVYSVAKKNDPYLVVQREGDRIQANVLIPGMQHPYAELRGHISSDGIIRGPVIDGMGENGLGRRGIRKLLLQLAKQVPELKGFQSGTRVGGVAARQGRARPVNVALGAAGTIAGTQLLGKGEAEASKGRLLLELLQAKGFKAEPVKNETVRVFFKDSFKFPISDGFLIQRGKGSFVGTTHEQVAKDIGYESLDDALSAGAVRVDPNPAGGKASHAYSYLGVEFAQGSGIAAKTARQIIEDNWDPSQYKNILVDIRRPNGMVTSHQFKDVESATDFLKKFGAIAAAVGATQLLGSKEAEAVQLPKPSLEVIRKFLTTSSESAIENTERTVARLMDQGHVDEADALSYIYRNLRERYSDGLEAGKDFKSEPLDIGPKTLEATATSLTNAFRRDRSKFNVAVYSDRPQSNVQYLREAPEGADVDYEYAYRFPPDEDPLSDVIGERAFRGPLRSMVSGYDEGDVPDRAFKVLLTTGADHPEKFFPVAQMHVVVRKEDPGVAYITDIKSALLDDQAEIALGELATAFSKHQESHGNPIHKLIALEDSAAEKKLRRGKKLLGAGAISAGTILSEGEAEASSVGDGAIASEFGLDYGPAPGDGLPRGKEHLKEFLAGGKAQVAEEPPKEEMVPVPVTPFDAALIEYYSPLIDDEEGGFPTVRSLEQNPNYQALSPEMKLDARRALWKKYMQYKPEVQAILKKDPQAYIRIRNKVLGLPEPSTAETLARSFIQGFETTLAGVAVPIFHAVDSLTGTQVGPKLERQLAQATAQHRQDIEPYQGAGGVAAEVAGQLMPFGAAIAGGAAFGTTLSTPTQVAINSLMMGAQEAVEARKARQELLIYLAEQDKAEMPLTEEQARHVVSLGGKDTAQAFKEGAVQGLMFDLGIRVGIKATKEAIKRGKGAVGLLWERFGAQGKQVVRGDIPENAADIPNMEKAIEESAELLDDGTDIVQRTLLGSNVRLVVIEPDSRFANPGLQIFLKDGWMISPGELLKGKYRGPLLRAPITVNEKGQKVGGYFLKGSGAIKKVTWDQVAEVRGSQGEINDLLEAIGLTVRLGDVPGAKPQLAGANLQRVGDKWVVTHDGDDLSGALEESVAQIKKQKANEPPLTRKFKKHLLEAGITHEQIESMTQAELIQELMRRRGQQ